MAKASWLAALLAACVLSATAACGYGDGPSNTTTPTISQGPSIQATIKDFTLPNLTVTVGTTVTWTNKDGVPHTTTSGRDGKFDGTGWNSSLLSKGQSFNYTFNEVGTFSYTCRLHSSMNGTTTVVAAGESPETSSGSNSGGSGSGGAGFY